MRLLDFTFNAIMSISITCQLYTAVNTQSKQLRAAAITVAAIGVILTLLLDSIT